MCDERAAVSRPGGRCEAERNRAAHTPRPIRSLPLNSPGRELPTRRVATLCWEYYSSTARLKYSESVRRPNVHLCATAANERARKREFPQSPPKGTCGRIDCIACGSRAAGSYRLYAIAIFCYRPRRVHPPGESNPIYESLRGMPYLGTLRTKC